MATAAVASKPRTFLGHPVGLYILFFTEMWERFSYYGMRALLILYMVNYFRWSQKDASTIYKMYTSLVYITPILGGYLADRYLGNRRAVIIGALLMAIGHFLMAFEEMPIFLRCAPIFDPGKRLLQTEHVDAGGPALCRQRRPARRGLHHFLHGHQPRSFSGAACMRLVSGEHRRRLPFRLHHGGHRHGGRARHLSCGPAVHQGTSSRRLDCQAGPSRVGECPAVGDPRSSSSRCEDSGRKRRTADRSPGREGTVSSRQILQGGARFPVYFGFCALWSGLRLDRGGPPRQGPGPG